MPKVKKKSDKQRQRLDKPDKTIVYKLTNVHEIDLLTGHAES